MAEVHTVVMRIFTQNGCVPIGEIRNRNSNARPGARYALRRVVVWRN